MQLLLEREDIDIQVEDELGETALSHAIARGHQVVAKMLEEKAIYLKNDPALFTAANSPHGQIQTETDTDSNPDIP